MDKKTFLTTIGLFFFLNVLTAQDFNFENSPDGILLLEDTHKVFFYQQNPKSLNDKPGRAHYLHPVYGLNGTILTEDFPEDHPHHRGIFWAWHEILIGDIKVADGWDTKNIQWHVNKTESKITKSYAELVTNVQWKIEDGNQVIFDIVDEKSSIRVFQPHKDLRRMDFEIHLKALVDSVRIAGSQDIKGYGGFSIRLFLPENVLFFVHEKPLIPKNEPVEGGEWLKITGNLGNRNDDPTQLILITHPKYPNSKQNWLLRKKGSMQNVVFPGKNAISMSKEKPIILKYSLLFHNKNTPKNLITDQIKSFQNSDISVLDDN